MRIVVLPQVVRILSCGGRWQWSADLLREGILENSFFLLNIDNSDLLQRVTINEIASVIGRDGEALSKISSLKFFSEHDIATSQNCFKTLRHQIFFLAFFCKASKSACHWVERHAVPCDSF